LPGSEGFDIAANYCIDKFKQSGLLAFDKTPNFKQFVPLENNRIIGPCEFSVIHYKRGRIKHKLGDNYNFRGFTGQGEKKLETVFCGYGISQDSYDDYANVNVKGKAVLIFKGEPNFDSIKTEAFSIRNRAKTAKEHGAEAVIFIPIPGTQRSKPVGSMMCGPGEFFPDLPLVQIDFETLQLLLDGTDFTVESLDKTIKSTQKSFSQELISKVFINVDANYVKEIKSYNTIAYIPGSNPNLANEYILVTAHIDHVGNQCEVVYPGANDNASGCTALLELARLFSIEKPERSIIFAFLTAEEQGLNGANFLANNLPVDSIKIVAAFNFDCIASGDSIQIGNGLSNPILYDIGVRNDLENILVKDTWKGGGADLTPFSQIGIPGLYFVSKYSYTNLHLPTDTFENANIPLLESIIKLGYKTIRTVANGDYQREVVTK
jgi:hypothetical protein